MARRKSVIRLVAGALVVCPLALALGLIAPRDGGQTPTVRSAIELPSAEVAGRVGYPDGRTFAAGVLVRVWSVPRAAFIHQTVTGRDGSYRLPPLPQGSYQLVFADRVRVELHVTADTGARTTVLNIVIPHGRAVFAQMPIEQKAAVLTALSAPSVADAAALGEGAAAGTAAGTAASGLLPAVAIGTGGFTAVAVTTDIGNSNDDRRRVNSP